MRAHEYLPFCGRLLAGALAMSSLLGLGARPASFARADEGAAVGSPEWKAYAAGLSASGLRSILIHPKAPDVLWAVVDGMGPARSTDDGASWTPYADGIDEKDLPGPRDEAALTLDPDDARVLYLATRGRIYKSENEGKIWTPISSGVLMSRSVDRLQANMRIGGIAVEPGNSQHVYAGTHAGEGYEGGLCESRDGGKRWNKLAGSDVKDSGLGRDAWPISLDSKTPKNILVGGDEGLFLSDDGGKSFKAIEFGEDLGPHEIRDLTDTVQKTVFACDARGVWGSRDGGKKWGKAPLHAGDALMVEVDPALRKRVLAVFHDRGLLVSDDPKHEKWESKNPYPELELRELAFHPRNRDLVFAASRVTGLHRSEDRGETFKGVTSNLPTVVPAMAVVAGHGAEEGRFLAATDEGVVYSSADRCVTWERVGRLGMTPTLIRPAGEKDAWWAAGPRLLRSADGGKTWEALKTSSDPKAPVDPEDRIVGLDLAEDGTLRVLFERERAVAVSADGGKTWTRSDSAGEGRAAWATSLAVDPRNPDHWLVATRSRSLPWNPRDPEGGPFETWDAGKTWRPLRRGIADKDEPRKQWNYGRAVGIDPVTGNLYYAADGAGLFVRAPEPPAERAGEKPEPGKGNDKNDKKDAANAEVPWTAVSDGGVPTPYFHAFLLAATPDRSDSELIVQVAGENEARAVLVTSGSKLASLLAAPPGGDKPRPWDAERTKDPGTRLASLTVDPSVPGRWVAADRWGMRGILVFEPSGAAPAAGAAKPAPSAEPEKPAPTAPGPEPARPPTSLLGLSAGVDKQVRAYDLSGGKALRTTSEHQGEVLVAALSPDGTLLATGSTDRTVRLWKTADGSAVATFGPAENGASVTALAWHPKGSAIYAGCRENWRIVRWDVDTKMAKRLDGHAGGVLALAVSSDGARLYSSGEDGRILVWDTAADARLPIEGFAFPGEVHSLAVSPDGTRLYAGGVASTVHAYSTGDGTEAGRVDLAPSQGTHALALSRDGTALYVAGSAGLRSLKAADLSPVATFAGPTAEVECVALSPDGAWAFAGDSAGTLWLFDVAAPGKAAWTVSAAHAGAVTAVGLATLAEAPAAPPAPPGGPPGGESPANPPGG